MKSSRALRKFAFTYLLLHVAAVLLFLMVVTPWLNRHLTNQLDQRMHAVAVLLRSQLMSLPEPLDSTQVQLIIQELADATQLRMTVIKPDGTVLADSHASQLDRSLGDLDNHLDRPEIARAAASHDIGTDRRMSKTLGIAMSYLAAPIPRSDDPTAIRGFVRVAVAQSEVDRVLQDWQRFVWMFAFLLAITAAVAMWIFTYREIQPLGEFSVAARRVAAGQYDAVPLVLGRRDEWRNLAEAFHHMQHELAARENRLVENSQRLEAVLSSMIEGVVALDPVGTVMLANEAACRILGVEQHQLLGRKLLELVRIPPLRQAIEKTQLQRTFSKVEYQTYDDPQRTISARVSSLAPDPQPGVAIVLHDVTELRQLEAVRRDFVANVSHELKTPLASIKAYAETLRLGALHDQEKNLEFLGQIEHQAQLLDAQIHDLLRLAKVESGQAVFDIVSLPVLPLCQHAVQTHAAEAKARGIHLVLSEMGPELKVKADADGITTILNNLITNAIRYTPSGGTVTVSAAARDNSVILEVHDTGIGIAPEHQRRIFERFYRVDRARSREAGGTGLGLSIVKHLCQSLGGSVHVASQLGKGSTFRVQLPLSP